MNSKNLNINEYIEESNILEDLDEYCQMNEKFIDDYFNNNSLIQMKMNPQLNLSNFSSYKNQLYENNDKLERLTYIPNEKLKSE